MEQGPPTPNLDRKGQVILWVSWDIMMLSRERLGRDSNRAAQDAALEN